jgi:hypothetical protein
MCFEACVDPRVQCSAFPCRSRNECETKTNMPYLALAHGCNVIVASLPTELLLFLALSTLAQTIQD